MEAPKSKKFKVCKKYSVRKEDASNCGVSLLKGGGHWIMSFPFWRDENEFFGLCCLNNVKFGESHLSKIISIVGLRV